MAVDVNKKIIRFCSMYRSGSTFIYNFVKKIKKDLNINYIVDKKRHEDWVHTVTEKDLSIYSYRDIRDAAASMIRKNDMEQIDKCLFQHKPGFRLAGGFNVNEFINNALKFYGLVNTIAESNNLLKIKYEDKILKNIQLSISDIFKFLKINVNEKIINEYSSFFDINKTKKFTDSLVKYDKKTEYYPDHIGTGKTNYKQYFSMKDLNKETRLNLEKWLIDHNYKI